MKLKALIFTACMLLWPLTSGAQSFMVQSTGTTASVGSVNPIASAPTAQVGSVNRTNPFAHSYNGSHADYTPQVSHSSSYNAPVLTPRAGRAGTRSGFGTSASGIGSMTAHPSINASGIADAPYTTSSPRKIGSVPGTPSETNPDEHPENDPQYQGQNSPVGDALLPLLLCMMAYAAYSLRKRKMANR